jgi:predicted SnoaL-like aldol condensation-catalyzing enzyme
MSRTPEETRNLARARAAYEAVLLPFDSSRVDEFFSPDYVQHSSLASEGLQALKDFLDGARNDTPQACTEIKRAFVDGEHVIFHVHVVLSPGDPGFAVADIFRIQDGLIAEHWDVIQQIPTELPNRNGMF